MSNANSLLLNKAKDICDKWSMKNGYKASLPSKKYILFIAVENKNVKK